MISLTMKALNKPFLLFIPLFALFGIYSIQPRMPITQQGFISSTPTYDPFAEPPLPPDPTEFELGRNLYWHWCMPCHGDRGQGLTDEFRAMWVPDHQNCWGRGCHAGRPNDMGFPIPAVVPALVSDTPLVRFASVQELSDFLKATHPPQSPGVLEDEEYNVIALFVFAMNKRPPINISITNTATLTPMPTSTQDPASNSFPIYAIIVFILLLIGVFALARKTCFQE